jgi:RND family efflux transporter MFP subunit
MAASATRLLPSRIPAARPRVRRRAQPLALALLLPVLTSSCGGDSSGDAANGGRNGGQRDRSQDPPTTVAVEPVDRGTVVARYTTTATLEAENRAEILARTRGVVEKIAHEEGDRVRANQELLRLEDDEARLRLQQAEVALKEQRSIFARQEASFQQQVVSAAEFDLAKANVEKSEVERDLAEHALSYTRVRAPFDGIVTRRTVEVGQSVNEGTALFEIASFKPLLARVHVPAKEMGALRVGQAVELVLDSNAERLAGVVRLVSPIIDASSGTVKVTVHVTDYPEGTRPGDFAHVSVVTQEHEGVLRVPNIAVFEDRGEHVVYVAQDSVAHRRVVEVGFIDDTHTEIRGGLEETESIVVKGQRSLRDGGGIRILETDAALKTEANRRPARRGGS